LASRFLSFVYKSLGVLAVGSGRDITFIHAHDEVVSEPIQIIDTTLQLLGLPHKIIQF